MEEAKRLQESEVIENSKKETVTSRHKMLGYTEPVAAWARSAQVQDRWGPNTKRGKWI